MAYRNLRINKNVSDIAKDLNMSRGTVSHWLDDTSDGLFEKQFKMESYYKNKENGFNPAIYDIVKSCVKNFHILSDLHSKNYNLQGQVSGEDILKYNKNMLNEIDDLKDFQAKMIRLHPSVKYASIMEKYYDEFLNDLSVLATICTDTSVATDPLSFKHMLENLEQTLWLYFLERRIGRSTLDTKQFNINNAFSDIIAELERLDSETRIDETSVEKRLQVLGNDEFKKEKQKIIDEYYTELKKMIGNKYESENYYRELNSQTFLIDENYFGNYQVSFVLYSMGTDAEKMAALKHILSFTDIYGRMTASNSINNIDKNLAVVNKFIKLLEQGNMPDRDYIDVVYDFFVPIHYEEEQYFFVKENVKVKAEIASPFFENDFCNMLETGQILTKWFDNNDYLPDNLCMVEKYLKWSVGFCESLKFNATINGMNCEFVKKYEQIKADSIYSTVKNEIDKAIVERWTDSIF